MGSEMCIRDRGWLFGVEDVADRDFLRAFQAWVAGRYSVTTSHSWASIIVANPGRGRDSLEDFFSLFDEFLEVYVQEWGHSNVE